MQTDGKQNILLATHDGMAICFDENDVRAMGRDAAGVRGIKLREGDYVVGAGIAPEGHGAALRHRKRLRQAHRRRRVSPRRGRRAPAPEPRRHGPQELQRAPKRPATSRTSRSSPATTTCSSSPTTARSSALRRPASSILGRATQGVRIMRPNPGAKVISVARTDREEEDGAEAEPSEAPESGETDE